MKKLICIITLMSLIGCILPNNQRETWTVMSWNVQNLFDGIDDGTEYSEYDPGRGVWTAKLFEDRLAKTGKVILETVDNGADLIVLQELENSRVLDALIAGPLDGKGYDYRLTIDGFAVIQNGIISRYPVYGVQVVDCGDWFGYSLRPAVGFMVEAPGGTVYVIALHWKSPRGNRNATEGARIIEAQQVRKMALDIFKGNKMARLLIIGDLNTPGDGAVEPAALAAYGGPATKSVIWRTDIPVFPPYSPDDLVLYDPEPQNGSGGTYYYQGKWDRPDRALLSQGLVDGHESGLRFASASIGIMDFMLNDDGSPMRWRTDLENGYSDHLPLVLTFENAKEILEEDE